MIEALGEEEARGSRVIGQPRLYRETLSQKQVNKQKPGGGGGEVWGGRNAMQNSGIKWKN